MTIITGSFDGKELNAAEKYKNSLPSCDLYTYKDPYLKNDDCLESKLEDCLIIFNKYKFVIRPKCLKNKDQNAFNSTLNKLKEKISQENIEELKTYAKFLYENLCC